MVELSIFREAVVERTRRIAGRSEQFQADGIFSAPLGDTTGNRPSGWLPRVLDFLPENARENIRIALGPDPRGEQGRSLLAAARRQMAEIRRREASLDSNARELEKRDRLLNERRIELSARQREAERLLERASRATETAAPLRVALGDVVYDPKKSPRPIAGVHRLAVNIKRFGQLTPVVVHRTDSGLELISGYRRMAALKIAGCTHVLIRVVDDIDEETAAALYIAENCLVQGQSPNAVKQLAEKIKASSPLAGIIELVIKDDEDVVEELYLDELVALAMLHLKEASAWLATLEPWWDDLEGEEQTQIGSLMGQFSKLTRKLRR